MRTRKRTVPLLLILVSIVSACSSGSQAPDDRTQRDIRCTNYQIDRDSSTTDDGLPRVNGIKGIRKTDTCKFEIVAMHDVYPKDFPKSQKPPTPDLVGVPEQITDRMWVHKWLSIESETPVKSQYLIIPVYTFQCVINEQYDPNFQCGIEVVANHKLSTYTELAYDITGGGGASLIGVNVNFGAGDSQKETIIQDNNVTLKGRLSKEKPAAWTALLVLHKEWERIGVAEVCYDAGATQCGIVKAKAKHNEDFLLERGTLSWPAVVNKFSKIVGPPGISALNPPPLPALHSDYVGGPQRILLGDIMTSLAASWKSTAISSQKRDLNGSIEIGVVKLGTGVQTGRETELASSAVLSYELDMTKSQPPDGRCFEILSVGGKASDQPITGMILREGCSY